MKIVYFHGFASSGASGTVETLRNELKDCEILAPDIPADPAEALPYLRKYCEDVKPDVIIGTSMGGMYAQQMFGFRKILVNPAFFMTRYGILKTGEHPYLNGRKDSTKTFKITKDIIQHYNQMERVQFKGITDFDRENTYGLFGTNDPKVHTYDKFKEYYPKAQWFEGEHRLNEKVLRKAVLPLLKKIMEA